MKFNSIYDKLVCAKKDTNYLYEIADSFEPILSKYSNRLLDKGDRTELFIFLINLLKNIDVKNFYNADKNISNASLINYINISVYHEYIKLFKRDKKKELMEDLIDEMPDQSDSGIDVLDKIELFQIIDCLSTKQKNVILLRYIYGFSDKEISSKMNISRQAVVGIRYRALKKLREVYTMV